MRVRLLLPLALAAALCAPEGARAGPPPWEELLKSGDPERREQGLDLLEKAGKDPAREKIAIKHLSDPDWGVQIRAARALSVLGGDAARDALADAAVLGEIAWVRDAAVAALAAMGPGDATARLLHAASAQKDPEKIVAAVDAAGRLAGGESLKKLRPFSRSPEPIVEAAGIRAVGLLGKDAAVRPVVLEFLRDVLGRRAEKKRFLGYAAAIDALVALDDSLARGLLANEAILGPDDDDFVPTRVARALARAEPAAAGTAVLGALESAKEPEHFRRWARLAGRVRARAARESLEGLLDHKEERVRSEAAKALGDLGDAAAVPRLAARLSDKSAWARLEAWTALGRVEPLEAFLARSGAAKADDQELVRLQFVVSCADRGDPAAIPALSEFLGDSAWRVSSAALATIGTLGIEADLPRIEPHVTNRAWQVRAAAFEGIGRLRAAKGIPRLVTGLEDKDPVVRGVCHANLQILSRQSYSADPARWRSWWAKNGAELRLVKKSRRTPEEKAREKGADDRYAPDVYTRKKRGIEVLQKARIIVVTGAWDHVERVLDHLRIPNTALRAQELKVAGLNPNQIVLVNCEGNVDSDAAERLKWFVNVGGYLMATDWAVTKAILACFPGYVKQYLAASTGNDVVVVEEALPGHPFTAGVFDGVPALQWWLEIQAFPVVVAWPERVEVLVDSRQMRQRYGSSPMAVTFRAGLGKVQHSVSHFFLQEEAFVKATKPRDRMVWAADHLGLTISEIRSLETAGRFEGQLNEETMRKIAPDYSMFRMIVNVVKEKEDWVEGL